MTELTLFALAAGLLMALWRGSVAAREVAFAAAQEACERAAVQLLDGTVVFKSWRAGRDRDGRLALSRTYLFDYSEDGASRRQGFVILRGHEVETVGLGPTLIGERAA